LTGFGQTAWNGNLPIQLRQPWRFRPRATALVFAPDRNGRGDDDLALRLFSGRIVETGQDVTGLG
jgi:hypothetical protein